jgi:CubicO group peptidase (beta-lactamase class C family)
MCRYLPFLPLLFLMFSCDNSSRKITKHEVVNDSFFVLTEKTQGFRKRFTDSIEDFFKQDFSGTVLFYKDGHLFKKAFGYRDYGKKVKMKVDDVFQLASVSKTVTGVATLLLIQDGKIGIDEPVVTYLPDFPYRGVTVRQLLNHRSGLANYMYYTDTFWKDTSTYMTNKEFYSFMVRNQPKPYLEPGVSFAYCNTNFALLAVLVEKVSGMTFPRFVEKRIFLPSGMRNSFFKGYKPERVTGEVMIGRYDRVDYSGTYYLDGVLGDKSLYSCVEDLFLFHKALSDGRLINDSLMTWMQTPSYKYNVYGGSYGLGFRLSNLPNGKWVYHNGWWRGFWTFFWNRFDKKSCFIILTNNKKSSHIDKVGLGELLLNTQ